MASKTTYIPRYLLPQYGALWRTTTRSTVFTRPLNAELGQVLVRYASGAKGPAPTSKSPAAKAAKHSAPTKPPPKTLSAKAAAAGVNPPNLPTPPATPRPAPAPPKPEPAAKAEAAAAAAAETPAPAAKPASTSKPADPSKPLVLEKPERFNPPSHGARLPRSTPRHYGGPMSDAELQAQKVKSYPGLPPPENTWAHWFINSRGIHLFITLGTLTSLAIYTFMANFNAKSPFAHLIPPISEFPRHPFQYLGVLVDVLRMHEEHESALTAEKRRRKVEDVAKRNEYRKAHGLDAPQGFWASSSKPAEQPQTAEPEPAPVVEPSEPEAVPAVATAAAVTGADSPAPEGKRKKYFGIF